MRMKVPKTKQKKTENKKLEWKIQELKAKNETARKDELSKDQRKTWISNKKSRPMKQEWKTEFKILIQEPNENKNEKPKKLNRNERPEKEWKTKMNYLRKKNESTN